MIKVAVIPGDGIGAEVCREAVRVMHTLEDVYDLSFSIETWDLGAERYLRDGVTITDEEFGRLTEESDGILIGALGDPRVPSNVHARDILLGLRFRLDLFVNYRPCVLLHPRLCPLANFDDRSIHLEIFRENTEGLYVNLGGRFKPGTRDEIALQESVNTWKGVERIVRAALRHAREKGRGRVTLVDKANAMPAAGALWRRVFEEVGQEFEEIERDAMYVDAMAMDLIRRPERYDVVVTSNLFGDILSDLAAELTGGLGLAPSANLNPGQHAMFEPVHGSAPDIAGKGLANPMGAIRSAGLLVEHFGHPEAREAVERVVRRAVAEGVTTPDLGGTHSTEDVGRWVAEKLAADERT
jgi:3-isopropylmalate dehydrogenase